MWKRDIAIAVLILLFGMGLGSAMRTVTYDNELLKLIEERK